MPLHSLLATSPRPTAILAISDELALGALAAATAGLRIPHDVAFVGWDDTRDATLAVPALTTSTKISARRASLPPRHCSPIRAPPAASVTASRLSRSRLCSMSIVASVSVAL